MADASAPGARSNAAPTRELTEATAMSRRELRDLAALLALPAMWVDREPGDIAEGLLGVLSRVLALQSAYVRFDDPAGGPGVERWWPDGPCIPKELQAVLAGTPAVERESLTVPVETQSERGTLRVTSMSPALPGEDGLVLVGSHRDDFPNVRELHMLRVVVAQATISIHAARSLARERAARIAAEAELGRRNAFLATLAQGLASPLTALAELARQASALAADPGATSTQAGEAAAPDPSANGAPEPQARQPSVTPRAHLTRRETEVLGLLAQGLSNREIAAILWLSDRTIERHITSLYRKIEVQRRSEATAYAMRHGLITSDAREQ